MAAVNRTRQLDSCEWDNSDPVHGCAEVRNAAGEKRVGDKAFLCYEDVVDVPLWVSDVRQNLINQTSFDWLETRLKL